MQAAWRAANPTANSGRGQFGGAGYGGSGRGLGERAAPDPARILESQRAREQLMMNMAKAMADARVTAIALKAVEHQPTLIAEATTPPFKSNGGVVSINTFMIHTPIITVPMGFSTDGIPAGLAFLGLPFSDATLIQFAFAYEQATHHRKPPASTPPLPTAATAD